MVQKNPPDSTYKNKGWAGWLGTGRIARKGLKFLPFEEGRKFVCSLNFKGQSEWREFAKSGSLPDDIPATLDRVYKDKGWTGYRDWLGTEYLPFEEARKLSRSLNLKSTTEWIKFAKSDNLPIGIPASPQHFYKEQGWAGIGDWLGY